MLKSKSQRQSTSERDFDVRKLFAGFCPPDDLDNADDESSNDWDDLNMQSLHLIPPRESSEFEKSEKPLESCGGVCGAKNQEEDSTSATRAVGFPEAELSAEELACTSPSCQKAMRVSSMDPENVGNDKAKKLPAPFCVSIFDESYQEVKRPPEKGNPSIQSDHVDATDHFVMADPLLDRMESASDDTPLHDEQSQKLNYASIFVLILILTLGVIYFSCLSTLNGVSIKQYIFRTISGVQQDTFKQKVKESEQQKTDGPSRKPWPGESEMARKETGECQRLMEATEPVSRISDEGIESFDAGKGDASIPDVATETHELETEQTTTLETTEGPRGDGFEVDGSEISKADEAVGPSISNNSSLKTDGVTSEETIEPSGEYQQLMKETEPVPGIFDEEQEKADARRGEASISDAAIETQELETEQTTTLETEEGSRGDGSMGMEVAGDGFEVDGSEISKADEAAGPSISNNSSLKTDGVISDGKIERSGEYQQPMKETEPVSRTFDEGQESFEAGKGDASVTNATIETQELETEQITTLETAEGPREGGSMGMKVVGDGFEVDGSEISNADEAAGPSISNNSSLKTDGAISDEIIERFGEYQRLVKETEPVSRIFDEEQEKADARRGEASISDAAIETQELETEQTTTLETEEGSRGDGSMGMEVAGDGFEVDGSAISNADEAAEP
eukprot:scaffold1537_cov108-Cylindrotheca_fusiformis.AAC.1